MLSKHRQACHLVLIAGIVALYYQQAGQFAPTGDGQKRSYRLPQRSERATWRLIEEELQPLGFDFDVNFYRDVVSRTPLGGREFLMVRHTERVDYSWAIVGPHRATAFFLKGSGFEYSLPTDSIVSHRSIEGAEALERRLQQVRAWTSGQPCPSWLKVSQRGKDRETYSPICLYMTDAQRRLRIFSVLTEDSQFSAIVSPGLGAPER